MLLLPPFLNVWMLKWNFHVLGDKGNSEGDFKLHTFMCSVRSYMNVSQSWKTEGGHILQCEEAEQSALAVLKQEILDDNDEAPTPRSLGSIQKVPSISDLSDPEASLGESAFCFALIAAAAGIRFSPPHAPHLALHTEGACINSFIMRILLFILFT